MKMPSLKQLIIISLLSICLSSCTGSPFSNSPQPNTWVTTKVEPIASKKAVRSKPAPTTLLSSTSSETPAPGGNLWERMAKDFQIPIPDDNPAVQQQIVWFQQHQGFLDKTIKRAAPYMYLVYEQVQQRNLPAELVLLPINESAYYPLAYSGAGAAGLWQLMPGTASKFGLKRNWWYDGRRDIFASTNAALDYLAYLQNYFNGNWLLALAAYDSGEGTVQAAIRRNESAGRDTDFWSLKLPQETMIYVPRMLALAKIIKNPAAYNIILPPIEDQPYLGKVEVGSQIKLTDAAKLADMSVGELKQLNPGYSRWSTVPNGPSHLLLPLTKIESFKEKLSTLPRVRQTSWGQYKIQHGDTLERIAAKYGTSVIMIKRVNNIRSDRGLVHGRIIKVPAVSHAIATVALNDDTASDKPSEANQITPTVVQEKTEQEATNETQGEENAPRVRISDIPKPTRIASPLTHTVKAGETLSHIARRNHVSVKQLQSWNKSIANKPLKPGMKITIQRTGSETKPKASTKVTIKKVIKPAPKRLYIVKSGDNLSKIARKTGVPIARLKQLNQLNSNALKPGMTLKLS